MASKKFLVELYYDVVSPFSYLCFEALCRYRQPWDMELSFKPFFLGGIMRESGNKPPAMVPNRARYLAKDLTRLSKFYQVPLKMPEEFMEWVLTSTTMNAQKFLLALQIEKPELVEPVTRAFYQRIFCDQKEIMSLECIPEVAQKGGVPQDLIKKCLDAIESDQIKSLLKKNTSEALELNAFGAPTMVAHIDGRKEMFFGQDRILLMGHLAGKPWLGPVPQNKL